MCSGHFPKKHHSLKKRERRLNRGSNFRKNRSFGLSKQQFFLAKHDSKQGAENWINLFSNQSRSPYLVRNSPWHLGQETQHFLREGGMWDVMFQQQDFILRILQMMGDDKQPELPVISIRSTRIGFSSKHQCGAWPRYNESLKTWFFIRSVFKFLDIWV